MEMSAILLILQVYFLMKKNGEKRRANCITRRKMLRRRRRSNIEDGERMDIDLCLWMAMLSTYYSADPVLNTRIWSLPKSDFWWRVIVMETFKEEDWLSHFRMSRTTFEFLSTQLRPFIRKTDTHMRMAIGVDQRVGIALWRLATNVEYRTIAQLFGVGIATVCVIVHEVCKAIREALQDTMVRIPRGDAAIEVVREFEVKWGFPQCFGAVDGSHIPIISPKEYRADYYNRKGFHSMVLQGLVDHRYRFMNVNFGYPGSVHDARVFSNSSLYRLGNNGALCPPIQREINGTQVPVVILGDSAYPLLPWLQKTFQ
nr:uncharacterized protein LOC129262749 [Lytechinus pictus]